jgi:hypothetical protein
MRYLFTSNMATFYTDPSIHESRENSGDNIDHGEVNARSREFVGNDELGEPPSTRLIKAPADADALDGTDDGGVCFACAYTRQGREDDPFNSGETTDAYDDMLKLISDNYAKGISNPQLVNMVFEYYENEIRTLGDFPTWTKKSIARHLLFHTNSEDVMMQEATSMLYSQIQSIRGRTWVENIMEGTVEPMHKNICLLDKLIRGLGDHLTKKKARKS